MLIETGTDGLHRHYRRIIACVGALLLVLAGVRIVAVFTLNINWDEFALLQRAVTTFRTGDLIGGGRPGLATLLLIPFATTCVNAVDTLVQARLLWTGMVGGAAVAFWFLMRGVLPATRHRWVALATGLGLWVLAAPFLHSSTEVRTDQPAILFGLLGGMALLASRDRFAWAPLAGALFGAGFLFSQKLLYVGGLVALLAAGQLVIDRDWRARREALRALLAGAAFALLVVGYREAIGLVAGAPTLLPMEGGLSTFEHYRQEVGWMHYRRMLPVLVPQIVALFCLVALTLAWLRDRSRHGPELLVAWAVVVAGVAVALFHAGRFVYFYMTLGLFPAAAGALIVGPALDRLGSPRRQALFLAIIWVPLTAFALLQAAAMTTQTQAHQRASLAWVEHTFPPDASGYHDLGAFACRDDPFPVRFGERLQLDFGGERREQHIRELTDEFRNRPVSFMIVPFDFQYPEELWRFWATRYVRYHAAVHVPGRTVRGEPGWTGDFEVIVPAEYVWHPTDGSSGPLEVDGTLLEPGAAVRLGEQRLYPLRLPEGGEGMLVMALPEPPAPDPTPFFTGAARSDRRR